MAIRDAITTISTTDMSIRERRDKIKNNMRITDEQIFIAGIVHYEMVMLEEMGRNGRVN